MSAWLKMRPDAEPVGGYLSLTLDSTVSAGDSRSAAEHAAAVERLASTVGHVHGPATFRHVTKDADGVSRQEWHVYVIATADTVDRFLAACDTALAF